MDKWRYRWSQTLHAPGRAFKTKHKKVWQVCCHFEICQILYKWTESSLEHVTWAIKTYVLKSLMKLRSHFLKYHIHVHLEDWRPESVHYQDRPWEVLALPLSLLMNADLSMVCEKHYLWVCWWTLISLWFVRSITSEFVDEHWSLYGL